MFRFCIKNHDFSRIAVLSRQEAHFGRSGADLERPGTSPNEPKVLQNALQNAMLKHCEKHSKTKRHAESGTSMK